MSQYWNLRTELKDKTTNLGNDDIEAYGQISVLLSKYVLKEAGKGLSANDFTNEDKDKLDGIESNAQRNVLETISVNNNPPIHPSLDRNININVPIKVSELENDLGYALLKNYSLEEDYADSYVGKSEISENVVTKVPESNSMVHLVGTVSCDGSQCLNFIECSYGSYDNNGCFSYFCTPVICSNDVNSENISATSNGFVCGKLIIGDLE